MSTPDLVQQIEHVIHVRFGNPDLLEQALTHASKKGVPNYERLEFLGDRVLGLVIADLLYAAFPNEKEGHLAKRHAALVQGTTLAEIAKEINLGRFIIVSDAESHYGGKNNENILADCMESLLGALYLDQGLDACTKIVKRLWDRRITMLTTPPQEPKTQLQEWAQQRGYPLPGYKIVARKGPDHAPVFTIEVQVKGHPGMRADGPSRRQAEKAAAALMLETILKEKNTKGSEQN